LFVEAPKTADQLGAISQRLGKLLPLMANMVEGGQTPLKGAAELEELGFSLVIFPGGIVRAIARTARDYYNSLANNGTTEPFRNRMFDFDGLNEVIGTPEMLSQGQWYDSLGRGNDKS